MGDVPFDRHTVFDSVLGTLTENQSFLLKPTMIGQFIITRLLRKPLT